MCEDSNRPPPDIPGTTAISQGSPSPSFPLEGTHEPQMRFDFPGVRIFGQNAHRDSGQPLIGSPDVPPEQPLFRDEEMDLLKQPPLPFNDWVGHWNSFLTDTLGDIPAKAASNTEEEK